jgi:hypothetical protein
VNVARISTVVVWLLLLPLSCSYSRTCRPFLPPSVNFRIGRGGNGHVINSVIITESELMIGSKMCAHRNEHPSHSTVLIALFSLLVPCHLKIRKQEGLTVREYRRATGERRTRTLLNIDSDCKPRQSPDTSISSLVSLLVAVGARHAERSAELRSGEHGIG